jgi:hypothetical protein
MSCTLLSFSKPQQKTQSKTVGEFGFGDSKLQAQYRVLELCRELRSKSCHSIGRCFSLVGRVLKSEAAVQITPLSRNGN